MRLSKIGLRIMMCAAMAFAAGCADEDPSLDPGSDSGLSDVGTVDGGDDSGLSDAGTGDTGTADADDTGRSDSGVEDGGTTDAGADTGSEDAGADTGTEDAGADTGTEDAGADTGSEDTGADTGSEDTGVVDAGDVGEDAGWDARSSFQIRAFADGEELDDGQGTSASVILIQGRLNDDFSGAAVSYSRGGLRFRTVTVEDDAFEFELPVEIGETVVIVRAEPRALRPVEIRRTFFGSIASRAGTHDRQCQGPGTAERCQELCEELGGDYDASWGHIGGCRNMPLAVSGDDLDFTDPDAPDPVDRATTHDQQCLGSTSDANREACQEICEGYGGTYDPDWGNIGGCRDMPGSGLSDLDFTDGTIYPAEPSREATRDQQCLGPTSAANIARCEELCEEYGGTHDPDWGNIGGCRDMPASSGDLDFSDGEIRPIDPDR